MIYILSKLFTYIVLPPAIFIWSLLIAGFLAKKFRIILISMGILFYLISIDPIANMLIAPLEKIQKIDKKADLVVVLGGGANKNDIIKTSPDGYKRLVYGVILAKNYNIPLLFTGGGNKKITEADMAKDDITLLEKSFGFKIKTFFEKHSKNTFQNAILTKKFIKSHNLSNTIYLVTSAYHMKRSMIIFKHFGFNVVPKPVGFIYSNKKFNLLPNIGALNKSYKAIHEYFGILSLYLRGI